MTQAYPNWFLPLAEPNFKRYLTRYVALPVRFLQIGAFTGDASEWLLQNVLTHPDSELVDVDTWEGSEEDAHRRFTWTDIEKLYDERMKPYKNVTKVKMTSDEYFRGLDSDERFNFAYIDGAHNALQVLRDATNSFNHLKVGGLIIFDDFFWRSGRGPFYDPEPGIEAFRKIYGQFTKTLEMNYQAWIQKTSEIE